MTYTPHVNMQAIETNKTCVIKNIICTHTENMNVTVIIHILILF